MSPSEKTVPQTPTTRLTRSKAARVNDENDEFQTDTEITPRPRANLFVQGTSGAEQISDTISTAGPAVRKTSRIKNSDEHKNSATAGLPRDPGPDQTEYLEDKTTGKLPTRFTRSKKGVDQKSTVGGNEDAYFRVVYTDVDALSKNGCSLYDFALAKVPKCPPTYSEAAMTSTRNPAKADIEMPRRDLQMKMLVHEPDFMRRAARTVMKKFKDSGLHFEAEGLTLGGVLGKEHPEFAKRTMPDMIRSEADVVHITRSVLIEPSLMLLQVMRELPTIKSSENPAETFKMRLEDLIRGKGYEKLYKVGACEPLGFGGPAIIDEDGKSKKVSVIPDLVHLEITIELRAQTGDEKGADEVTEAIKFALGEIKNPNAMDVGEKSDFRKCMEIDVESGKTFRCITYRWPEEVDDLKGNKANKMICQVRYKVVRLAET